MERIDQLERVKRLWRNVGCVSLAGFLVLAGVVFSQGTGQTKTINEAKPAEFPNEPLAVTYTNFANVSTTPEEVIFDLGLNTKFDPNPPQVRPSHRVVMSYFTVKRLSNLLQKVVQQHEAVYGPIEIDVQKRVLPNAKIPDGK